MNAEDDPLDLEYAKLTADDISRLVERGRRMRSDYIAHQGGRFRAMLRRLQGRRAEVRVVWRPQMS